MRVQFGHVHVAVLQVLLEHPTRDTKSTDAWGRTPLHLAAREGHVAAVQTLLAHRVCVTGTKDCCGRTAADLAEVRGHIAIAELINGKHSGKSTLNTQHCLH